MMIYKKKDLIALGEHYLRKHKMIWMIIAIASLFTTACFILGFVLASIHEGKVTPSASGALISASISLLPLGIFATIYSIKLKRDTLLLGCECLEGKVKRGRHPSTNYEDFSGKELYELLKNKEEVEYLYSKFVPIGEKPNIQDTDSDNQYIKPKQVDEIVDDAIDEEEIDDDHFWDDELTDEEFDDLMD